MNDSLYDQGLDPCSSLYTTNTKVFLWNPGYPSSPLTGSSTCTCSVETSCDSRIMLTAIDLRLGTSTTCKQHITITDGSTVIIFDCNDNNDYLPTPLYVSTSHFIQIQIVDNLGLANGYYFLLLQGTSSGAELTLSCGSTALASPSIPSTSLSDCSRTDVTTKMKTLPTVTSTDPYIGSEVSNPPMLSTKKETMTIMTTPKVVTTESTTTQPFTSTKSDISSEAPILSMQSTNVETMIIPTDFGTYSVIKDSHTTSDISHNVVTSRDLPITRENEVTLTTRNDVNATEKTITDLYSKTNNEITIPGGKTTNRSTDGISYSTEINNSQTTKDVLNYTPTESVYVTLGWTSTLQNLTVTRSFTPISPDSNNSQKTPLTEIEQTTFTNASVSVDRSSPNTIRRK
ncbi:location of vulva defective 1-like [Mytilus trossulus]|uniref:location of vulva defective 1-like n=1 Tax=Mytilus trossulus TaxID=6551 RepID=UPI0030068E07